MIILSKELLREVVNDLKIYFKEEVEVDKKSESIILFKIGDKAQLVLALREGNVRLAVVRTEISIPMQFILSLEEKILAENGVYRDRI